MTFVQTDAEPRATAAPPAPARHRLSGRAWLSIGLFTALFVLLGLPLIVTGLWSLVDPAKGWFAPALLPGGLAFDHWQSMTAQPGLIASVFRSLFISACVVALSALLGLPTAFALAKIPFRGKRAVEVFILAPLIVPGLIVGIGVGLVFYRLNLSYTIPGVILAQTIGTLPFMIRVLAATIENLPMDLLHAARTLGASPAHVVWRIIVPLCWPGFVAGGLLSFISSFEEFEKTFIVGAPLVETLTIKLWATLGGKLIIFPNAAVVTFILLLPTILVFILAERALRNENALAAGMGKL